VTAPLVAAVAVAAAVLLLPARGDRARARLRPAQVEGPPVPADAVATLADRLAGVARAGLPPSRVWAVLAGRPGPHAPLAREVLPWLAVGVPAGRALRAVATRPGSGPPADLACLAVALDACERAGAPLAPALEGLAAALRSQEEARRERETALAAPRATAAVMTALPAVGLLLGAALGADPLAVLAGTTAGRASLVLGVAFWATGRWWIRRLVALAEPAAERAREAAGRAR
jgi:tight adherence protein B